MNQSKYAIPGWIMLPVAVLVTFALAVAPNLNSFSGNYLLVTFLQSNPLRPVSAAELLGIVQRPDFVQVQEDSVQWQMMEQALSPWAFLAIRTLSGSSIDTSNLLSNGRVPQEFISFWSAFSYAQQGEVSKAQELIRNEQVLIEHLSNSGLALVSKHDITTGVALLEAVVTLSEPRLASPEVYQALSQVAYSELKNREQALIWAHEWIKADSQNADAYVWVAALYLWGGQPSLAYEVLHSGQLANVEQHRSYAGQMGQIYQANNEWSQAIQYYRIAWDNAQGYPQERLFMAWYLGNALVQDGQPDEAMQFLYIALESGIPSVQEQASQLLKKLDSTQ